MAALFVLNKHEQGVDKELNEVFLCRTSFSILEECPGVSCPSGRMTGDLPIVEGHFGDGTKAAGRYESLVILAIRHSAEDIIPDL